jgi:hypothetical protein
MSEFERLEFQPWMGYVAGVMVSVAGWEIHSELGMFARALGFTLIFGTNARSRYRRRKRTGAGGIVVAFDVRGAGGGNRTHTTVKVTGF